jgi:hypothetical protein
MVFDGEQSIFGVGVQIELSNHLVVHDQFQSIVLHGAPVVGQRGPIWSFKAVSSTPPAFSIREQ